MPLGCWSVLYVEGRRKLRHDPGDLARSICSRHGQSDTRRSDLADQRTAALFYAGNFVAASSAFFCALWLWASYRRRLFRDEMCDEGIRLRTLRMVIAVPAFAIPCVVAIWSPISAIAIDGAIIVSFLLSDGWLERRIGTLDAAARRLRQRALAGA